MSTNVRSDRNSNADLPLMQATMRINTLIFCIILGLLTGFILFALGLASGGRSGNHSNVIVTLMGVFLPGYAAGWHGALMGLLWGALIGGVLGGCIYWINYRDALERADELVAMDDGNGDFPVAVLRLVGSSLGLAIGSMGALGLIATTNWLVLRGTAEQSTHARLLSHFLPGYAVDLAGSLIGAIELFVILYVLCVAFAHIHNRVVEFRQRRIDSDKCRP
jgi:hypothetical protein